jgi:hypothetical protein
MRPTNKRGPAVPEAKPDTFFDLSYCGALPQLLRRLADRLESRDCEASEFQWQLSKERLHFSASIDMRSK